MLSELQDVAVIALDTEHNAHRSYLGVTCLLQLSTGVLKVVHGGANDVLWLQRDAHLYLVNLFDTEKAAQVLGRQERSLASLLRYYCGVAQDKTFQTADWRIRPLPVLLQRYAQADVHWLIYLAARLVAELQARSPGTSGVDDEGIQFILPDAAMFQLAQLPPASARQLLRVVKRAVDALNQAVQHLRPYASTWLVSPAVRRSAKQLVRMLKNDPPTIRLLFEHKNADQQVGLDGFYSTSRANRCVVCGQEEHYLRYRVVPACYRRCFPPHLKSHRSHDIVLLCIDCHQEAHKAAEGVKRDIAAEYGIPLQPVQAAIKQRHQRLPNSLVGAESADAELDLGNAVQDGNVEQLFLEEQQQLQGQARGAAVALVRFGDAIPAARKQQLEQVIAQFMGSASNAEQADSIKTEDRRAPMQRPMHSHQDCSKSGTEGTCRSSSGAIDWSGHSRDRNRNMAELGHQWHGQQVVTAALAQGGEEALQQLVKRFRRAFVLTCKPRYLPQAWDIDAVDCRQFGDYSVYAQNGSAASAAAADCAAAVEAVGSAVAT
eukprot:gene3770-4029_t